MAAKSGVMRNHGALLALASALLTGASFPLAKALLGEVDPWLMAALLYLGAGFGLAAIRLAGWLAGWPQNEAPLRRAHLPWLLAVVLVGGVAGPVLLMLGLAATPGAEASLLLVLETPFTLAIAWLVLREAADAQVVAGAALIVAGAILLAWPGGGLSLNLGALAVAGACLCWAIDNNLTRRLSSVDPRAITMWKGLVAGGANLALALVQGASLPRMGALGAALLIGVMGYGVSLVFFVRALRLIGAGRTSALFAAAPFIGAALSVPIFAEAVTPQLGAAALLMVAGVALHLLERHSHPHRHDGMAHEHRHLHDAHHRHAHGPDDPQGEPHSHRHEHGELEHAHPHFPDAHHRHRHG